LKLKPTIKVKPLAHFQGQLPHYQTQGASGADVHAAISEPLMMKAGTRALVPTGMCVEIPEGFEIQVRPRSGLAVKNGVTLTNSPGTIDHDYRGELKVAMINLGQEDFVIHPGDRIAQLVVAPVVKATFVITDGELTASNRGEGGFGSTDSKKATAER
jgi:dUTP pyrophosphatase